MKATKATALCVCAILAAGCGEKAETVVSAPARAEHLEHADPGQPMGEWADFTFKTTAGKPVSLAQYKGSILLVDVWSYT